MAVLDTAVESGSPEADATVTEVVVTIISVGGSAAVSLAPVVGGRGTEECTTASRELAKAADTALESDEKKLLVAAAVAGAPAARGGEEAPACTGSATTPSSSSVSPFGFSAGDGPESGDDSSTTV